uniref:Uncharacterized protein n=1 Tax=Coccidioides posadasii RMSCC 3488 TaxID=454284 RepID=A0A0J6EXY5_COCPO|nr:hypothetical protein CPAG_01787 [Coccidioides posadasii RMSCC 3488]
MIESLKRRGIGEEAAFIGANDLANSIINYAVTQYRSSKAEEEEEDDDDTCRHVAPKCLLSRELTAHTPKATQGHARSRDGDTHDAPTRLSATLKLLAGRLVVGWVTTSECCFQVQCS